LSIKAKKSLGQHFLTDRNVISKIYNSIGASPDQRVIEIGPGTGALTEFLYQKFPNLLAIEVDKRAIEVLNEKIPDLEILSEDVLKVDWSTLFENTNAKAVVVGNLPYYISSPILFSVLDNRSLFERAYFMVQKEVAERIVSEPGSKEYGILSVQCQLMSKVKILFHVSPNSFSPPPKVESSVIELEFSTGELGCKLQNLKTVVRTAFNQRRKKLSNALKPVLGDYKPEGFDLDLRAENWAPSDYEKLTVQLEEHGILS
jgi:16S rRNA (adenine1518-N6/adenine1519-N6)-dimethyltransferase